MVQKGGEVLDGSAFAEKALSVYQSIGKTRESNIELKKLRLKSGEEILEITNSEWPSFALRGSIPGLDGTFELRQAYILSSHHQGWNEFYLDLLGNASFPVSGQIIGLFRINGEVERIQIFSGQIRLKSGRLTGNAALTPLRNRRERIIALTEWMQQHQQLLLQLPLEQETGLSDESSFTSQKEFEDFWKGRLFPELVSKKKRPVGYTENTELRRAEFANKADGIRWNRSYTEQFFPEELWEYRNSGALLRDWEEALPWIYMEYSWDYIISSFNETNLLKVK